MGGPWERIPCIYLKCSIKYGVLKNSQNSQENICVRVSFFKKNAGLRFAALLEKRLRHRCAPVNFSKFLRTPISVNTSKQLPMSFYLPVTLFC